jgi:phospholipid/cholesterol/gamma-HCH transport system permease protein
MEAIRLVDIGTGLFKSIIFGALVSTVAVFQGFSVLRASTEIPQAGIRAVGQSLVLLVVADAFITVLSYLI